MRLRAVACTRLVTHQQQSLRASSDKEKSPTPIDRKVHSIDTKHRQSNRPPSHLHFISTSNPPNQQPRTLSYQTLILYKHPHDLLRPRKHKEEQSHQDGEEQHERPPPPPSQRRRIRQHAHDRLHDQARQRRRDPDKRSLALGQTQSQKVGFEVCPGMPLDRRGRERYMMRSWGKGSLQRL